MSEATGFLYVVLPVNFTDDRFYMEGGITWEDMEDIFHIAGAGALKDCSAKTAYFQGQPFGAYGIEKKPMGLCFEPCTDDWVPVLERLVTLGRGIEIYGCLCGEHGDNTLYLLNENTRFLQEFIDSNDCMGEPLVQQWLGLLPTELKEIAPELWCYFK